MPLPLSTLLTLLLLLPGLAWWVWFEREGDFTSRLTDAIGISLALPTLIGLATFLFGWRFSGTAVLWLYGLVGLVIVVLLIQRLRKSPISKPSMPLRTGLQYLISNINYQ